MLIAEKEGFRRVTSRMNAKGMSVGAYAHRTFSFRIHRATDGMRTMRSIVRMPARYEPGHTKCASKGEAQKMKELAFGEFYR